MSSIRTVSTLTDRYQTTVPEPVRKALSLGKRDQIEYTEVEPGVIVLRRASAEEQIDEAAQAFLRFLERQMVNEASSLTPITAERIARIRALTAGVEVDLNELID